MVKQKAFASFKKDYTALKGYMLGSGYMTALKALSFAEELHDGFRKNGYTPEFHHQITICFTLLNLRDLKEIEEDCLVLALLHDVLEDKCVTEAQLIEQFGELHARRAAAIAKKRKVVLAGDINQGSYVENLSRDPVTIIVKGADRSHNVQSMHDAFSVDKINAYLSETKSVHLPLLRLGRKRFPKYHFAFAALSFMLKRQVELYETISRRIS